MTTTPDSRIRADWTLPPTVAPDTSTTAEKIAVMQAAERIESTPLNPRDHAYGRWAPVSGWGLQDYRIAPPPAPRSALQAARKHRSAWKGAHNPDSLHLEPLLREIDSAPLVLISMHTIGFGTEANPYPAIVQWVDGDPKAMQPGRYRLVRDDAP